MSESVMRIAIRDITKHIEETHFQLTGKRLGGSNYSDYIIGNKLYTKETIRLNRVLGLHKINKEIPHNKIW